MLQTANLLLLRVVFAHQVVQKHVAFLVEQTPLVFKLTQHAFENIVKMQIAWFLE